MRRKPKVTRPPAPPSPEILATRRAMAAANITSKNFNGVTIILPIIISIPKDYDGNQD